MSDWRTLATCCGADLDEFFPKSDRPVKGRKHSDQVTPVAQRYCQPCPVIRPCFRMARDTHSRFGLFAGCWWPAYGRPVPLVPAAQALIKEAS